MREETFALISSNIISASYFLLPLLRILLDSFNTSSSDWYCFCAKRVSNSANAFKAKPIWSNPRNEISPVCSNLRYVANFIPALDAKPSCVRLNSRRRVLTLVAICIASSAGLVILNDNILCDEIIKNNLNDVKKYDIKNTCLEYLEVFKK